MGHERLKYVVWTLVMSVIQRPSNFVWRPGGSAGFGVNLTYHKLLFASTTLHYKKMQLK